MTSNKLFVTYERSTCKSNPLADACFRVSTVSSRKRVSVTRGHFESVQAHLKFFPFENITKVMKFVNLAQPRSPGSGRVGENPGNEVEFGILLVVKTRPNLDC